MFEFDVTPAVPFRGGYELEATLAQIPGAQQVKGMFFSRHIERLGAEWARVEAQLVGPPRFGRYVPFIDYPLIDYSRVAHESAAIAHPGLPGQEAMRRTARDDQSEFAQSTLGAVMLSVVSNARSMLLKYPTAYERCVRGQTLSATELGANQIRFDFTGMHGICTYTVGQIEGMVLTYQDRCRVRGRHDAAVGKLTVEVEF